MTKILTNDNSENTSVSHQNLHGKIDDYYELGILREGMKTRQHQKYNVRLATHIMTVNLTPFISIAINFPPFKFPLFPDRRLPKQCIQTFGHFRNV